VFVRFLTNKEWILRKSSPRLPGVSHDTIARGELALKRKHIIAAKAKENQGRRTDLNLLENSAKSKPINTRAEIAKIAGVSRWDNARGTATAT
jgi:hypothetical protein